MAVAKTKQVEKQDNAKAWEIKDRMYYLLGDVTPLTYKIKSKILLGLMKKLVTKEK